MALPILDGNQSATTLSTILSSGQHITAHTVVSLGTQAITDMRGAVSGSVVSISNFPATQTIAGSVTLGAGTAEIGTVKPAKTQSGNAQFLAVDDGSGKLFTSTLLTAGTAQIGSVTASISGTVPISISSVTVGNSVTIGSLPLIAGTVTANVGAVDQFALKSALDEYALNYNDAWPIKYANTHEGDPFPISGTVTANLFGYDQANDSQSKLQVTEDGFLIVSGTVAVGNSVTIASFATSVTARLINPAGTSVTYAEVGTAGNPSIDVLSVQGVTSGTPLTILNHQGTTVTTSNFTSTTASTVLASANTSREVLTIFNEGAGNLHICAGATCTTIAYQVRLSAGDYYEVPLNQTSLTHSAVFATAGTARIVQIS